jgi:hypothetical protein
LRSTRPVLLDRRQAFRPLSSRWTVTLILPELGSRVRLDDIGFAMMETTIKQARLRAEDHLGDEAPI